MNQFNQPPSPPKRTETAEEKKLREIEMANIMRDALSDDLEDGHRLALFVIENNLDFPKGLQNIGDYMDYFKKKGFELQHDTRGGYLEVAENILRLALPMMGK